MTPELQEYARKDDGYQQFCKQYDLVACDPQARKEYTLWVAEQMCQHGIRQTAYEDGMEAGKKDGMEIGKKEGKKEADEHWQGIVDSLVAEKDAVIVELQKQLESKKNP